MTAATRALARALAAREGPSDMHVIPLGQEHEAGPACWCQPIVSWADPANGARIWLHRRTHDHGHHYRDDEG